MKNKIHLFLCIFFLKNSYPLSPGNIGYNLPQVSSITPVSNSPTPPVKSAASVITPPSQTALANATINPAQNSTTTSSNQNTQTQNDGAQALAVKVSPDLPVINEVEEVLEDDPDIEKQAESIVKPVVKEKAKEDFKEDLENRVEKNIKQEAEKKAVQLLPEILPENSVAQTAPQPENLKHHGVESEVAGLMHHIERKKVEPLHPFEIYGR